MVSIAGLAYQGLLNFGLLSISYDLRI